MTDLLNELLAGTAKKRGAIRAVLKKDDIRKSLDRIERAKSALLLAQSMYQSGLMQTGLDEVNNRLEMLQLAIFTSGATTAIALPERASGIQGTKSDNSTDDVCLRTPLPSRSLTSSPKRGTLVTRLKLNPLPWFLNKTWEVAFYRATQGWNITLRANRIVSTRCPFFVACKNGDIAEVHRMLTDGSASVFD